MGYFQDDRAQFLIERRAARRTRATCAASLRTPTGERIGHLWDLSETGARISVDDPPGEGETGQLKFGAEHVRCRVVWVEYDICGLEFDQPISPEVVASTARMIGIAEQPAAAIGNIPVGRKRSAATLAEEPSEGRRSLLAIRSPGPRSSP
jgi:hypothetical protein